MRKWSSEGIVLRADELPPAPIVVQAHPPLTSCAVTGGGWQTVSNVLSEASCNLSYDDSVKPGRQQVIYDNTYSVTCAGGTYQPSVYVGNAPSQSNWGAFVNNSATCQMRTGTLPSGARGVLTIVCP